MAKRPVLTKSDVQFRAEIQALIAGFQSEYTATSTLMVSGRSMTQPQVIAALQAKDALFGSVQTADTAKEQAIESMENGRADAKTFIADVVAGVRSDKGSNTPELRAFGIQSTVTVRKPRTAAQNAISAAKRAATRAARGIKGKAQRAAITLQGENGLALLSPTGAVLPGVVQAPVAPAVPTTAEPAPSEAAPPASTSPATTPTH